MGAHIFFFKFQKKKIVAKFLVACFLITRKRYRSFKNQHRKENRKKIHIILYFSFKKKFTRSNIIQVTKKQVL